MIVASLLLILVAVVLLVLGLAGGSSTLLISSIVASLLAAVALVIGARQATAGRRAVGEPLPADLEDPPSTTAAADRGEPVSTGRGEPVSAVRGAGQAASPDHSAMAAAFAEADLPVRPVTFAEPDTSGSAPTATSDAEDAQASPGHSRDDRDPAWDAAVASDSEPDRAAAHAAGQRDSGADRAGGAGGAGGAAGQRDSEADRAAARAAGQRDTEAVLGDRSWTAAGGAGPDVTQRLERDAEGPDVLGAARAPHSGPDADRTAGDYDQASSMIGGARAEDDDSWRRASDAAPTVADSSSESSWSESGRAGEPAWSESGRAGEPAWSDSGRAEESSWSGRGEPVAAGEFGDPDPDDPDDEPLPQKVRPADAVRVARLDAEVVVVDGRPRYHVADCPHLSGRQTEGLPVAEAVELGFSPCGQCRPVDRLVAAAVRH
ncbi:clumping factor A [Couchioplanes caeruleus]|uniref:Clumping factor A n=2 Tax=Couchioplanes caeruleus TaxID=56438 RepID=A0A1K0GV28_9ACTN|nr:hypothetical protein [Couchioplanes caeruleus]OJF13259.1 hypothetical protein BG844_16065 [Couchioplanes caeruleus subsp. caeruleus]ROP29198.1 clumping factor A [Couchioplanes caeruleus]